MTGTEGSWSALDAALELCAADGHPVDFWLRDDDAVAPSAALDHLIEQSAVYDIPLALAVIPAGATQALADRLAPLAAVTVLQHGFSHSDHSAPDAKKSELGPERALDVVAEELGRGRDRLAMFARTAPILVPPWNRIDPAVADRLPQLGFAALSVYGDRAFQGPGPKPQIRRINTHLDPVDWHGTRGFIGEEIVLGRLIDRLQRQARGDADRREATGILTHHLVHDRKTFDFLENLFRTVAGHGFCRWLSAETLLRLDAVSKGAPTR